jgi:hypothetical protein
MAKYVACDNITAMGSWHLNMVMGDGCSCSPGQTFESIGTGVAKKIR